MNSKTFLYSPRLTNLSFQSLFRISTNMSLPDFMTDPNAVLNDKDHEWRYNIVPDYSKANALYAEGEFHLSLFKSTKSY